MAAVQVLCVLKQRREAAGLSQAALAERVHVSRQALIAVEAGRTVPSTALALQLARALGCAVDDLFVLPTPSCLEATLAPRIAAPGASGGDRVVLGRIGDRWVAHLIDDASGTAADALIRVPATRDEDRVVVAPLVDPGDLENHVLVAGCAPLLGVLAQRVGRRYRDAQVTWLPADSRRSLDLLASDLVHVAGLHLRDESSGTDNLPFVARRFTERMVIVHLTAWRQGFVVPKGNPLAIREAGDLLRPGLRFARREAGAGASELTARLLAAAGVEASLPAGPLAGGHAAVAQLVQSGVADCGVAIENAAIAFGLDFIPLSEERFDLAVPAGTASAKPVARLIDFLNDAVFRAEAALLPGYDCAMSGSVTVLAGDH